MKWESIKIGQAHKDFVPSRLQAPWCWSAFQAGHVSLHSKTFMEGSKAWGCLCASRTKGAVMPPALSPEDSYKREVLQGKMEGWENQGMGRKPSRSAEQKEVHFLNWGLQLAGEPAAQPSQHLHSLLRMSLPWLPRDKQPDHLLHLPHPTSPLNICLTGSRGLLPLPSRQRHMVFSYSCISSIRVWGVSCFGSAAPSADNACHLIYRQWHAKCPFGESPIIMSLAFREVIR